MDKTNERKQVVLRLVFRDINGDLAAPTQIKYKLSDLVTNNTIIDTTTVNTTTSTVDVTLTALNNAIVTDALSWEPKLFSLEWYSAGVQLGSEEYIFTLKNNRKIPLS